MSPSRPERLRIIFKWIKGPVLKLGYELYDVEELKISGNTVLRITIDCDAGVQLEDCVSVDELVQQILDEKDPIPDKYTLEVSSPGLFRTLSVPDHFHKCSGQRIKLKLDKNNSKICSGIGKLIKSTEVGIVFVAEIGQAKEIFIDYQSIIRANLEPELN